MTTYSQYSEIRCPRVFPLRQLVEDCCRQLASRLEARAIRTIIDVPAGQMIEGDRALLGRAARNLILAAIDAMPCGGTLVATSAAGRGAVELEIADSGESLSEKELNCVFTPSGEVHRGTSDWALAAVRRIAEAHRGSVAVANCPEGGVAFTLRIPNSAALEAAA